MEKLIEITDPKEMEKFVKSSNYLLVDDGLDEYVIHESDLVDYIYNRNEEVTIYKPDGEFNDGIAASFKTLLSTVA